MTVPHHRQHSVPRVFLLGSPVGTGPSSAHSDILLILLLLLIPPCPTPSQAGRKLLSRLRLVADPSQLTAL